MSSDLYIKAISRHCKACDKVGNNLKSHCLGQREEYVVHGVSFYCLVRRPAPRKNRGNNEEHSTSDLYRIAFRSEIVITTSTA